MIDGRKLSSTNNSVEMFPILNSSDQLNESFNSSNNTTTTTTNTNFINDDSSSYSTAREDANTVYNFNNKSLHAKNSVQSEKYVKHLTSNLPNVHVFVKKQKSQPNGQSSTSSSSACIPNRIKMKKKDLRYTFLAFIF